MKTRPRFLWFVGAGTVCAFLAWWSFAVGADDLAEALPTLEAAVQKSAAGRNTANAEQTGLDTASRVVEHDVRSLRESLVRGDARQVEEMLNQIVACDHSEAVRRACDDLRAKLRLQLVANQQENTRQARSALDGVAVAMKSATKPADLDHFLQELGEIHQRLVSQPDAAGVYQQAEKVASAQRLVASWQDYLGERQRGDFSNAVRSLKSLLNQLPPGVMTSSESLDRIAELKAQQEQPSANGLDEIIARLKTLDDIAPALLALRVLQTKLASNTYNPGDPVSNALETLEVYNRVYNEYQAGLPTGLNEQYSNVNYRKVLPKELLNLKAQLLRLVYARNLEVEDRLKPGPNEPIVEYLNRVWNDARERCDARLMLRLQKLTDHTSYQLYASLYDSFGPSMQRSERYDALQALLSAQNQEEARQFVLAVISCQAALHHGGETVSSRAIGDHLEAIKAAHPADYERGLQLFLNPPVR